MKLLTGQDPITKSFCCHIRTYNSTLAMTSVGRHLDNSVNDGCGPYTFKLHGELYSTGLQLVGGFAPKPPVAMLTNNINNDQIFTIFGTFRLTKFGNVI